MAYNTFTYKNVMARLGIEIQPSIKMYDSIPSIQPSDWLLNSLSDVERFYLSSEAARRERYLAPIFQEVMRKMDYQITVYSDIEFIVDKELQLTGIADYLFGIPPMLLVAKSPIIAVAEAKIGNLDSGLGQ